VRPGLRWCRVRVGNLWRHKWTEWTTLSGPLTGAEDDVAAAGITDTEDKLLVDDLLATMHATGKPHTLDPTPSSLDPKP